MVEFLSFIPYGGYNEESIIKGVFSYVETVIWL